MLQKWRIVWFGLLVCVNTVYAQKDGCVVAQINSLSDHSPIPFAQIRIKETGQQTQADSLGRFEVCGIGKGRKTLLIRQLGFDSLVLLFAPGSKKLLLHLRETGRMLHSVDVIGQHRHFESEVVEAARLSKTELEQNRGASLGELARKIPGVSALQTGPTIFKPVIQGLTGQRIAVINNGAKIEGQQWGFDHAPEADPASGDELVIVKGAQAVRYGAEAVGGVVLILPGTIGTSQLSGSVASGFASNGKGMFGGLRLEKSHQKKHRFDWRILVNGKKSGNFNTPKYVLGNTAMQEWSASALVRHNYKKWNSEVFGSFFSTQVGIFSGAHISSPEGIRHALYRPDSNYRYSFSYTVGRPYQNIEHLIGKLKTEYTWSESQSFQIVYNQQMDRREEYDLQRISSTGCTDCPQLRFTLHSQQLELGHIWRKNRYEGRSGIVGLTQANVVERHILIPNFRVYQGAAYTVHTFYAGKWAFEAGLRIEQRHQQIFRYVATVFENPTHSYFSYMANAGGRWEWNDHWHLKINTQLSKRPPSVNELYSNGVHHGTATYEKGDPGIGPEQIWNTNVSAHQRSEKWQFLLNLFYTFSPNFIYLSPNGDSTVTTVRGVFPVFSYKASTVSMRGIDAFLGYDVTRTCHIFLKGAMIRSWNETQGDYLIFQPADRIEAGIRIRKPMAEDRWMLSIEMALTGVAMQNHAPSHGDLAPPPSGYMLLNGRLTLNHKHHFMPFELSVEARNMGNTMYREYMNRFRYYAYDLGQNWIVRLMVPFGK